MSLLPLLPHRSPEVRRRSWRRRTIVAACVLATAVAAALLARFAAVVFVVHPPPLQMSDAADQDAGCMADQIQSLDSWQLARLARVPVSVPRKRVWEDSFASPAALQAALAERLVGWPAGALVDRATLPRDPSAFAWRLARDTWRGLDALTDREHGLPLDRVAFAPSSVAVADAHIGDYTSTTDIGLRLIDIVAANDLGLIDEEAARERIRRTLDTLAQLETDDGLYFNYYDTTSLERTSQFVSFVDSGWLTAGLMAVRARFPEFYALCSALIDQMGGQVFYDRGYDQVSHGYFVEPRGPSRYHYGVFYTEARLAALIAIGKGDIPESVWFDMVRTFPAACHWQSATPRGVHEKSVLGHHLTAGYYEWDETRYVPSWGGSMFEALMPTVVLDELQLAPDSLGANDRAHALLQQRFATRELGLPVWGLSPSATPGSTTYGEYGVAKLGSLGYPPGPVTPHASALALAVAPDAALANLLQLAARYEIYGDFGFYDAVDPRSGRVANDYLSLDQSMIFLALANYLADHAVQKRFSADPIIERVLPLLAAEHFFD